MKKWIVYSAESCPSCSALHNQVHDESDFQAWSLTPKSARLFCKDKCSCKLVDTEEEKERGSLAMVPVRLTMNDEKTQLQLSAAPTNAGEFEILAITAGIGNGWEFPAQVLQDSLPLVDKVHCYLDHSVPGHSVKDLAGVLHSPTWDDQAQGIRAKLRPVGPGARALTALGESSLANPELLQNVGFSADVLLECAPGTKKVKRIQRYLSVDAVLHPARGGRFVRLLNSIQEMLPMNDDQKVQDEQAETQAVQSLMADDVAAVKLAAENAQQANLSLCADLLSSGLNASKLPSSMQEYVRKQFSGRVYKASELQAAIDEQRVILSDLQGSSVIKGPVRLSGMFSSEDQILAAVDDMFGNERDPRYAKVQAARLSGVRELYLGLTGDYDLHGSIVSERAMFQLTTSNFPVIVKNAMNKALIRHWEELGKKGYDWFMKIATVVPFTSLNDITWSIFGTVGSLPTVLEGAEYTPLKIGDGGETSSFVKKGGYIGLTLEAIDRDDTGALKRVPKELAFAGIREISATVAALFTANSAVGPTLADGAALFNNVAVTTAGGHANLLTTALGTDTVQWEVIASAMYNQPMLVAGESGYYGTGKKLAIDPSIILVPRALRGAANNIFTLRQPSVTTNSDWYGNVDVVTVPEWTDGTDYAAVIDPKLIPGVMIGTRFGLQPEIFVAGNETDPAVFMNDESRIKVRHFTAVGIADWRPLHKENV
jgi:hypothetical protein